MVDTKVKSRDPFEQSTGTYREFYAPGSREDLEFRLTRKLVLTARRWTAASEEPIRAATGQTRARWQTLLALAIADSSATTSTLSSRLGVRWPPLIRTLNGLEADGLVRRRENAADKRSRFLEITEEGRRVVEGVRPVLAQVRGDVLEELSDDELVLATRLLDMILNGTLAPE